MDFILRCNSLKCRAPLSGRAVVTTCSHIFCEPCSHSLGMMTAHAGHRACPACQTSLPNPDDAVATTLNPSEDYKTSVLSGLSPTMILECAGRGLSFWSYQSTQEIVYQEFLAKSLNEKYGNSKLEIDQIINQANAEIDALTQRLNDMTVDNDRLRTESQTLAINLKERARKHQQTQELYDRLKRKQMTAATQFAAQSAIEDTLDGHDWNSNENTAQFQQRPNSNRNGAEQVDLRRSAALNGTPHRTRLGSGLHGSSGLRNVTNNAPAFTPRQRQPLNRMSPNANRMNGYGMRAGLKVGTQNATNAGQENMDSSMHRSPRHTSFAPPNPGAATSFFR